jgi:hypothetical protein
MTHFSRCKSKWDVALQDLLAVNGARASAGGRPKTRIHVKVHKNDETKFMAIQSKGKRASTEDVEKQISTICTNFNFVYLLNHYVEKDRWLEEVKSCFGVVHVDNLTDFNYSNCFVYAVNEGGFELCVGEPRFIEYLGKNVELNRVQVMISALGPYLTFRYLKYKNTDGKISLISYEPHAQFRRDVESKIIKLCEKNNLYVIEDDILKKTIKNVSMELAGQNPSVFNLLFEDGSSRFPY